MCLVDPVCGFVMLIVVVLSSVCCSTGLGDAVQDRHDSNVSVGPVCRFVMLDIVVLFDLLCVVQLALVNLVDLIPRLWLRHAQCCCFIFRVLFNCRW